MKLLDCEQGSIEWFAARAGRVTASRLKDLCATLKSGKASATRQDYILELVTERLLGQPIDRFANVAMTWGTDQEPHARNAYEAATGHLVSEVGFALHDHLPLGASPDGLVGDDGAIEIKCPWNIVVSIRTRIDGMPPEHMPQVQGVLFVTGRQWCDFISYDPRLPAALRCYVQRIEPILEWHEKIQVAVKAAEDDINAIMEKLK